MGKERRPFANDGGHAHGKRCGDEVGLACNPAGITDDIHDVIGGGFEYGMHGMRDPCEPGSVGVYDAFGFTGRARRINDKQRPVGFHGNHRLQSVQSGLELGVAQILKVSHIIGIELGEKLLLGRCHQIVRISIPVVFNDLLSGISGHHNVANVVPYLRQGNSDFGAQLCAHFWSYICKIG